MADVVTETDFARLMEKLSNWGRWGADDELGTLNLITPERRKRAAALVREGVTVTCARPIVTEVTADTTFQPMRFMVDSGEGRDTCSPERTLQRRGASEFIGLPRLHDHARGHAGTLLLAGQDLQRAVL